MGKRTVFRHVRQIAAHSVFNIASDDAQMVAEIVTLGILLAQNGITRIKLNACYMQKRVARQQAHGGYASANTCFKNSFAIDGWNARRQENGINTRAIAFFGLQDLQFPTQKRIIGER